MASFTTRVELHTASSADYETLHDALARLGFSRTIRADDGRWYHLPWAEYSYEGAVSVSHVLNAANAAAATTGRQFSVLVSEASQRMWHNLERCPEQEHRTPST